MSGRVFNISVSKWKTWTTCQRKAYYKYYLNLEPKRKARPLAIGSLGHQCIAAYLLAKDIRAIKKPILEFRKSLAKLPDEERALYQDIPAGIARTLRAYCLYYQDHKNLTIIRYQGAPLIERSLTVSLTKDVVLEFTMDRYVEDAFGEWVMDSKWLSRLPSDDYRTGDMQSAIYCFGAQALGLKPQGIIWDYISSHFPTVPKLTQTGRVSRAKIRTDPATFLEFLKKNDLSREEYEDILSTLSYKDFFKRVRKQRPKVLVKNLVLELVTVARRFGEAMETGPRAFVRSLNWTCDQSCQDYRHLCLAELQGQDLDFVIRTYYQKRRDESGEEETEE